MGCFGSRHVLGDRDNSGHFSERRPRTKCRSVEDRKRCRRAPLSQSAQNVKQFSPTCNIALECEQRKQTNKRRGLARVPTVGEGATNSFIPKRRGWRRCISWHDIFTQCAIVWLVQWSVLGSKTSALSPCRDMRINRVHVGTVRPVSVLIIIIIIIRNTYIAPNPTRLTQSTSQFKTRNITIKT